MLFGAYADANNGLGGPTPKQTETAHAMEDFLLAFMTDPWNGPSNVGFPRFDSKADGGGTIVRWGADGKAMSMVDADGVQAACTGNGKYDPFP
jgi:hypothetical protein